MAIITVAGCFNGWAQATPSIPPLNQPANPQNRVAPATPGTNVIGDARQNRSLTNLNPNLASNLPAFALTNRFGVTNSLRGSNRFVNFSNSKLSTLAPEHVNTVIQLQASLDSLQQASAKLRNTANVAQAMDQSPYFQQQLGIIAAELNELTQDAVRPSSNMVGRLSRNLAHALVSAQLSEDQQLAISAAFHQIANSGTLTEAEVNESVATVQAALLSAGAPKTVVEPVASDLRAFALEVQPRPTQ